MNSYYWTEDEKNFVKENYQKMPCRKIARTLRRSESAVWVQARKLGVARKKGEVTTYAIDKIEPYKWSEYLMKLQIINPVAYALVKPHSKVLEFSPDKIILGLKSETFIKQANEKRFSLELAATEYFGKKPEISFRLLSSEDFKPKKVKPKAEKLKTVKKNPEKNTISILTDVIIGLSVTTIILALILFVMFVR